MSIAATMANGMIQKGLRMKGGWIGQRAGEVGRGVGPDRPEGDVAEVEQAGEADDDVEAHGEQHVDRNLGGEDRLDARVHVQGPLDRHEQRGDRDRRLPVGELRLFRDPGELESVAPFGR